MAECSLVDKFQFVHTLGVRIRVLSYALRGHRYSADCTGMASAAGLAYVDLRARSARIRLLARPAFVSWGRWEGTGSRAFRHQYFTSRASLCCSTGISYSSGFPESEVKARRNSQLLDCNHASGSFGIDIIYHAGHRKRRQFLGSKCQMGRRWRRDIAYYRDGRRDTP